MPKEAQRETCPKCHLVLSTAAAQRRRCAECGTPLSPRYTGQDPRRQGPAPNEIRRPQ